MRKLFVIPLLCMVFSLSFSCSDDTQINCINGVNTVTGDCLACPIGFSLDNTGLCVNEDTTPANDCGDSIDMRVQLIDDFQVPIKTVADFFLVKDNFIYEPIQIQNELNNMYLFEGLTMCQDYSVRINLPCHFEKENDVHFVVRDFELFVYNQDLIAMLNNCDQ